MNEFIAFPKIARWSRDIVITEKLDGTNAQVMLDLGYAADAGAPSITQVGGFYIYAGSRNRWLEPGKEKDNFGFAAWVHDSAQELAKLGEGRHFGEWWGQGIQRGYGLKEKRFSLFSHHRWADDTVRPSCVGVVPVLYEGPVAYIDTIFNNLKQHGSHAAPGFMNPEGIIIYHTAARVLFKKTFEQDAEGKDGKSS